MSRNHEAHPDALGRFDQSFFVRMTLSFLGFLLAVAVIELGLRFAFEVYDFRQRQDGATQIAAERLANDVRSIMLNRGGPVASRTVYPILQRNYEVAGLSVAIEPAAVTSSSIRAVFGFEPLGLPPSWREGTHHESRVELRAEEFCLQCHGEAGVGDVLGTVTVRSYLDTSLEGWWDDVRLSVPLNFVKIVVNVAILFLLLRTLMTPLLSLRAAVARLAKGAGGLTTRADVVSADEFGQLANDLNAFLDRVQEIIADLEVAVTRMMALNGRLEGVSVRGRAHVARLSGLLHSSVVTMGHGMLATNPDGVSDLHRLVDELERRVGASDEDGQRKLRRLRQRLEGIRREWRRYGRIRSDLPRLVEEVHEVRHVMQEVGFLEDQLAGVMEAGRRVLGRLAGPAGEEQSA
jgi:hypothetical protein